METALMYRENKYKHNLKYNIYDNKAIVIRQEKRYSVTNNIESLPMALHMYVHTQMQTEIHSQ